MASHHPTAELDSGTTDSLTSTPCSIHSNIPEDTLAAPRPRVRFMCSFGGKILPRPHDNQLRYVGGDTRIVAVNRHSTFSSLLRKLSKLSGTSNFSVKYQLPNEDLDALITVATDEDVENMMDEYDRLVLTHKSARLRIFLFSADSDSRASSISSISSLLDGSTKREHWFLDAINGGSGLERWQSEVSSIVSEVPDYLFGLDNSDEAPREFSSKLRNKSNLSENHPGSDPGSPAPVVSSPFCSTSSSLAPPNLPAIPDLPPVKTKPINPVQISEPSKEAPVETVAEGGQQTGCTSNPMWHYQCPTVQPVPVYYVPGPVRAGKVPVHLGAPYIQRTPVPQGQVPLGFDYPVSSRGQVFGGGARPIMAMDPMSGVNQPIYYGVRNVGMVPTYPGMVVSGLEEIQGPGLDVKMGRVSQS